MTKLFGSLLALVLLTAAPALAQFEVVVPARVRMAPPAVRVEVRTAQPSPNHVWVGGHWYWAGGRHVWAQGMWVPRRPGNEWVQARWVQEGPEWVLQPGHWQPIAVAPPQPVVEEVMVEQAPPPPQVEVVGVAPSPNHFWIGGHWGWEGGRHVWRGGRWEMRRGGQTWEQAHWVNAGGRWRYMPGHSAASLIHRAGPV